MIRPENYNNKLLQSLITDDQFNKISIYHKLLLETNKHTNLISKNTENIFLHRHVLDSLQLSQYIDSSSDIIDLGTGAGLPGIILAIIGLKVSMVDSNNKKVKFVQKVIDELGLQSIIYHSRIEEWQGRTDILTARAVKPLSILFDMLYPNIQVNKKMLFLKGKNTMKEILDAKKKWCFKYNLLPSITSQESHIIEIYNIKNLSS